MLDCHKFHKLWCITYNLVTDLFARNVFYIILNSQSLNISNCLKLSTFLQGLTLTFFPTCSFTLVVRKHEILFSNFLNDKTR